MSTLITPNVNPANSPVSKISKIANKPAANHAGPVNLAGPACEGGAVVANVEAASGEVGAPISRRNIALILVGGSWIVDLAVRAPGFMRCVEHRKTGLMGVRSWSANSCKHISSATVPVSASARVRLPGGRGYEREAPRSNKESIRLTAMAGIHNRSPSIETTSIRGAVISVACIYRYYPGTGVYNSKSIQHSK